MVLDAIIHGLSVLVWYVGALLCELLDLIYDMFKVLVGMDTIFIVTDADTGATSEDYLINALFFGNSYITTVYWYLALIGMALAFGFALWAVVKKMFDSTGKVKSTYGGILTNTFKAILLMLLMTTIIGWTITGTNVLMQQIMFAFDHAGDVGKPEYIEFEDEDYATMFRILNTIGNYDLNRDSRATRYNVNACFNDIKGDLQKLRNDSNGAFFEYDYKYVKVTEKGYNANGELYIKEIGTKEVNSWQSAISKIGQSHSIYTECALDRYYPAVQEAILECMELMEKDKSFGPLPDRIYIDPGQDQKAEDITPGRIVLLTASMGAAYEECGKDGAFFGLFGGVEAQGVAADAGLEDHIRKPFYRGTKDVYDLDEVEEVFDVDFGNWNHIIAIFGSYFMIKEFAACLLNAVARIFNLMLLYLISPLVLAVYPLDEGGKFKQWSTAFIVQALGVFGTVIAIRLMMLFIPIVMSASIIIFKDSAFMNLAAKVVIILGASITCSKASAMITGILADNAGFAALQAGDIGNSARAAVSAGKSIATGIAGGAAGKVADVTGLTTLGNKIAGGMNDAGAALKERGGLPGIIFGGGGKDGASGKGGAGGASGANGKNGAAGGADGAGGGAGGRSGADTRSMKEPPLPPQAQRK